MLDLISESEHLLSDLLALHSIDVKESINVDGLLNPEWVQYLFGLTLLKSQSVQLNVEHFRDSHDPISLFSSSSLTL